jgi:hypothetical protein
VDVCPWALREGIVLHYLQTTHQESFDLPLRPLASTPYLHDRSRRGSPVTLVAESAQAPVTP